MRRPNRPTRRPSARPVRSFHRTSVVVAGVGAGLALSTGVASAHDCFIPMYSLKAPQTTNWETVTAEQAAVFVADYEAPCPAASRAGYAALKAARLPVAIKIFLGKDGEMTIGEGSANPNLADGKGLEHFEAGSGVPFQMVETWVVAASQHPC